MIVTLWGFIGIEGASVFSARAEKRADVGRATVIGFSGALIIYVLVSLLSTGILTQPQLAGLPVPSMAEVLESLVGWWGAALVSVGLVVAVAGSFLSWMLLSAEIPYAAARDGSFPRWFAAENRVGSPVNSLWISNGLIIQAFPDPGPGAQLQLPVPLHLPSPRSRSCRPMYSQGALCPETGVDRRRPTRALDLRRRIGDAFVGAIATGYGLWLCYAAKLNDLLLATILFAPATLIYMLRPLGAAPADVHRARGGHRDRRLSGGGFGHLGPPHEPYRRLTLRGAAETSRIRSRSARAPD